MGKVKTSKGQKKSEILTFTPYVRDDKLFLDRKLMAQVFAETLLDGDIDSFRDVLITHLDVISKTKLAKETGLGRQTIYDLMKAESFDPKLSTLFALFGNN